jgi:hypothetical protein
MIVILVPCMLLFDDLMADATGWLTVTWVLVLGLVATMPIGMMIGALVPSTQKVGSWGMLPVMVLGGISGIFYPVQQLWWWVEGLAQVFPMYWIALGMRSAFLPDEAAALEVGGSWRTWETLGVLGAWAVVGALLTPVCCGGWHDGRPVRRWRRRATRACSGSTEPFRQLRRYDAPFTSMIVPLAKPRIRRCQPEHGGRHLLGAGDPAERRLRAHGVTARAVEHLARHLGLDEPGCHGADGDALRRQGEGQ